MSRIAASPRLTMATRLNTRPSPPVDQRCARRDTPAPGSVHPSVYRLAAPCRRQRTLRGSSCGKRPKAIGRPRLTRAGANEVAARFVTLRPRNRLNADFSTCPAGRWGCCRAASDFSRPSRSAPTRPPRRWAASRWPLPPGRRCCRTGWCVRSMERTASERPATSATLGEHARAAILSRGVRRAVRAWPGPPAEAFDVGVEPPEEGGEGGHLLRRPVHQHPLQAVDVPGALVVEVALARLRQAGLAGDAAVVGLVLAPCTTGPGTQTLPSEAGFAPACSSAAAPRSRPRPSLSPFRRAGTSTRPLTPSPPPRPRTAEGGADQAARARPGGTAQQTGGHALPRASGRDGPALRAARKRPQRVAARRRESR